jgi:hypothetical protein
MVTTEEFASKMNYFMEKISGVQEVVKVTSHIGEGVDNHLR